MDEPLAGVNPKLAEEILQIILNLSEKGISILMLPVIILLLIYTATQGIVIDGANASRWVKIPIIGLSFQTSTLASVVIMVFTANYLSKPNLRSIKFSKSLIQLWIPVLTVVLLIFPSNLSTAALLFAMVLILAFVADYPLRYLITICGIVLSFVLLFFILVKEFPGKFPNRIDTWVSRIENFSSGKSEDGNYQIARAKTAIVSGKVFGLGAGKSRMKNFLPQSSSDLLVASPSLLANVISENLSLIHI